MLCFGFLRQEVWERVSSTRSGARLMTTDSRLLAQKLQQRKMLWADFVCLANFHPYSPEVATQTDVYHVIGVVC